MILRNIDAFAGGWRISRVITDRRAGTTGWFDGRADLRADPAGGLIWVETGQLRLGDGPVLSATRRYLWQEQGARITVLFEDGRYFHDFDPSGAGAQAHHDCPPDVYDVVYDFADWPRWRCTWKVRGPRKDYRMESLHQPG